jgi:hypothetical protein
MSTGGEGEYYLHHERGWTTTLPSVRGQQGRTAYRTQSVAVNRK